MRGTWSLQCRKRCELGRVPKPCLDLVPPPALTAGLRVVLSSARHKYVIRLLLVDEPDPPHVSLYAFRRGAFVPAVLVDLGAQPVHEVFLDTRVVAGDEDWDIKLQRC